MGEGRGNQDELRHPGGDLCFGILVDYHHAGFWKAAEALCREVGLPHTLVAATAKLVHSNASEPEVLDVIGAPKGGQYNDGMSLPYLRSLDI